MGSGLSKSGLNLAAVGKKIFLANLCFDASNVNSLTRRQSL